MSATWNHTVIQAYSLQGSGFVRVGLMITDAFGAPLNVSSNAIFFADLSPYIVGVSGINGSGIVSDVPTLGGKIITIREC